MGANNSLALNLGLLVFSFILTSTLIVPFINILYRLRFTRRIEAPKKGKIPTFDKLHDTKAGTPVGGGIIILATVSFIFALIFPLVSYLGVFVHGAYDIDSEIKIIFLSFISFGLLGLYDDLVKLFGKMTPGKMGNWVGLRRGPKFALQWVLALVISYMLYDNLQISIVHLPLTNTVLHLGYFYIPFAALAIVSFANAINITDGLDGLSAGVLMICLFAFWIIASSTFDTPLSIFISLWLGALIAFLYFNVWPARIFMGDAGALAFGATLAVIGLLTGKIFALGIIGGIFVVEVLSSFIQIAARKFLGRPILPGAPIHFWLQLRGWEEPKIVMRAWLAGLMLAIFGLWLAVI
jgi:phospho-N-acetylmuramoyl-pentapeptide-transferase